MIVPRHSETDVRLMLDAEGYRGRRADALRQRALDLAREVKERNQEAELEPLPAHERRIIHAALSEDPNVSTYSEGDEPHRRIVISPNSETALISACLCRIIELYGGDWCRPGRCCFRQHAEAPWAS